MENKKYDLIVVGGGASGLMAAGRAAEYGLHVLLLEKNKRLGEKLRITGGGRCNITNAEEDLKKILKIYGSAEPFLYSLFAQFGVKDTFTFFESHGLPLIIENYKRTFPKTEKAEDVVSVLVKYLQKGKVDVFTNSPVTNVYTEKNKIISVSCGKKEYIAKNYLFATGCVSHPETGSTGDGFKWLEKLGHNIAKPTPSIVPLAVKDVWVKNLAGITIPLMKITFYSEGKKQFNLKGKILFTHFGLSGPLILNSAHKVADILHNEEVSALIDLYPNTDEGELDQKIINIFDKNKNKTFKNVLKELVPEGTQKGILLLFSKQLDTSLKINLITKEKRKIILHLLKALPLTITGLMGYDKAIVADGGVPLTEIDLKTMRSKKVSNLFVTGDLLHIHRPSGGYSLQLCWSTGYVAGSHASDINMLK